MATTAKGLRYPVATDPFQPHLDTQRLAEDVDAQIPGAWNVATVGVSQPGPVSFDATASWARWQKNGRIVHVRADVLITGTGVGGNVLRLYVGGASLPIPVSTPQRACGVFWYFDAGANNRMGVCQLNTDDGPYFTGWIDNAGPSLSQFGIAPNVAAASGDRVVITATYESAS